MHVPGPQPCPARDVAPTATWGRSRHSVSVFAGSQSGRPLGKRMAMDPSSRLSILYVEDEPDIRETLTEILQLHDYDVVPVESSEAAMSELRRGCFDLLLTDYNLPGQSGGWLIEEGQQLGLLQGTALLVVTAHPTPRMAPDVVVMRKPLDIDHFLRQVQELLQPAAEARANKRVGHARASAPIDLVLYVSPDSPASLRALRNLHALLERFPGLPVKLTVRDLAECSAESEGDHVAYAPTLVKRGPGPRAWILGTLDDVQPVLDLLRVEGLAPAAVG